MSDECGSPPFDRLRSLLQREMERLAGDLCRTRLFFEFWALGARDPAIADRISRALEGYRSALRSITEEVLRSESVAFAGVTADGLAAVAVSFINRCAVQAMNDPHHFDIGEYLAAVRGLIGQLASTAAYRESAPRRCGCHDV